MPKLFKTTAAMAGPLLAVSLVLPVSAQESRQHRAGSVTLDVTSVADGLEHPWSVEVLADGAYIVTERPGRIRIIRAGEVGRPLGGLPRIAAVGQGGLLDLALAPDFAETRRLFFTAAVSGPGGQGTAVFSARLSDNERRLEDVRRIFLMNKGSIVQNGTPEQIYTRPASEFVAGFIGNYNLLDADKASQLLQRPISGRIAIRPEAIELSRSGELDALVRSHSLLGNVIRYRIEARGVELVVDVLNRSADDLHPDGQRLALSIDPSALCEVA